MATKEPILSARDVEIQFSLRGRKLTAIRKCSLDLYEGETLAIVGESGSGKSVFTKSFIGMLDANGSIIGGSIMYDGVDISKYKTEKEWMTIRGKKIAMVMQDPMTSLNPLKVVGKQIQESIELHQGLKGEEAKKEAIEMLRKVGIPNPERRYNQYPHEFSGGMRQRVVIAIAVACRPQILICDEPTTALDVTIQAQILDLVHSLQKELHMTVIYITHDLGVVANVADRVAVTPGISPRFNRFCKGKLENNLSTGGSFQFNTLAIFFQQIGNIFSTLIPRFFSSFLLRWL